ncbi:MAG: protein kinase [bacterium]|nr:MAG: protein kinase [bacterium]
MQDLIGQTISHYKVLQKLGSGGMGVVYKAEDTKLNRTVALKFLPPELSQLEEAKRRFIHEAQAASVLEHQNICTIHEIDETADHQLFICMAYYDGETLRERIQREPLSLNEVNAMALQIAQGLLQAHAAGIIHRDLKPANIILTKSGEVRILDFGLAKFIGETTLSKPNTLPGTIPYMSPEQIRGEKVDFRTDIWSFGVILYEMISGIQPFSGEYEQAILYCILNEKPKSFSSLNKRVPEKLEQLVRQCLEKEPERRFQNIEDLLSELKAPPSELKTEIYAKSRLQWTKKQIQILMLVVAFAVLFLLISFPTTRSQLKQLLGFDNLPPDKHLAFLPISLPVEEESLRPYFDGLTEIIASNLTQINPANGKLWIVPFREVCEENISSVVDARKEFGVNLAITGHYLSTKNRIQLVFNLVDTEKLRQIRSTIVEGQVSENFLLQDKIINELEAMLEINPEAKIPENEFKTPVINPEAYDYYIRGIGYLQKSDLPENLNSGIELLQKSVELDPQFALAQAKLGEAYWQKFLNSNDPQWITYAESHCQKALQLNPENPVVLVCNGHLQSGTGHPEQAKNSFQSALIQDSLFADAYRGLARVYETMGQFPEAENAYLKSTQIQPAYWRNYNSLGVFYYRQGQYQKAVTQFQKVIDLTPESSKGYYNLGGIYFFLGDWQKAEAMFQNSVEIDPSEVGYSNLGTLNFYLKNYEKSTLMYERALALSDKDYQVWAGLAAAYHQQKNQQEKSKNCYQKAISLAQEQLKINPGDLEIMADLAGYHASIGNNNEAVELVQVLIGQKPENVETYFRIGEVFEMLGQREEALRWIEKALKEGFSRKMIEASPGLKNLREDKEYSQIIK